MSLNLKFNSRDSIESINEPEPEQSFESTLNGNELIYKLDIKGTTENNSNEFVPLYQENTPMN